MQADVVMVLERAQALVARPGGWTQGAYARNPKGRKVSLFGRVACCWCASGALWRAAEGFPPDVRLFAMRRLQDACVPHFAAWNDAPERTQADVVAAFDRALALARLTSGDGAGRAAEDTKGADE